jgi:hypothetical protein
MRKELKLIMTVANLAARNAKDAMVACMVGYGGVCVWQESGVRRLILCWCDQRESGFSRREDVFAFYSLYTELLQMYFQRDLQI